jgi:hypothetical protein
MTLAENERSEVRSASGIIPGAKRRGISDTFFRSEANNLKVTVGLKSWSNYPIAFGYWKLSPKQSEVGSMQANSDLSGCGNSINHVIPAQTGIQGKHHFCVGCIVPWDKRKSVWCPPISMSLVRRIRKFRFLPREKGGNSVDAFTARNEGDGFFRFQLQGLLGCQIDGFSYHG